MECEVGKELPGLVVSRSDVHGSIVFGSIDRFFRSARGGACTACHTRLSIYLLIPLLVQVPGKAPGFLKDTGLPLEAPCTETHVETLQVLHRSPRALAVTAADQLIDLHSDLGLLLN